MKLREVSLKKIVLIISVLDKKKSTVLEDKDSPSYKVLMVDCGPEAQVKGISRGQPLLPTPHPLSSSLEHSCIITVC